jgi:hypothetical protein
MAEKIHRSRISNIEWGLVIGVLLVIDGIQLLLDFFVIGVIANRGISVLVGMALPFYLHIRGEKMSDPKRLFGFLAAFGLESFLPFVDGLPFWFLDGIYNFILAKRRNKAADKQDAGQVVLEKQQKNEKDTLQAQRIMQIRQQQQHDDQDLYDRAA